MKRSLKWLILSLTIILVSMVGYYGYSIFHFANDISHNKKFSSPKTTTVDNTTAPSDNNTSTPKAAWDHRINILLMGGDSRGLHKNETPRSDSIMIASLDPQTKQAYLLSVLRDTYVKIPGYGKDRINAALAYGGPQLAEKTVSDFLGIPIQYYVYTDFKGFIALIDALGGMNYYVEKRMYYTDSADDHKYDINLQKGYQHLDGKTALEYVRFRHDSESDFGRTERQRKFLQAVAEKLQSTTSLFKLPKILNSIDPYIQTDISVMDMMKLASLGYECKASGVITEQIPPRNLLKEEVITEGGIKADVLGTDADKVKAYVSEVFKKTNTKIEATSASK